MAETSTADAPPIPGKKYFQIGEVSELCDVKPHVLRYWEQEFPQIKPVRRAGNRRYYQYRDVMIVRQVRALLYDQGFTISGARQHLKKRDGKAEATESRLLIKQMLAEAESLLELLKS